MIRRTFQNGSVDNRGLPIDAPQDAVRVEFARRVQAKMFAKGMYQSELARAVEAHLNGSKFGRDSISHYIRGRHLPNPTYLNALSKALDCKPEDLLPSRGLSSAQEVAPALDMRQTSDGNIWLRVNQAVSATTALEVMKLLQLENK